MQNIKAEINVPGKYLAALSCFAAVHDVRDYLKGVYVEVTANESRLYAADGVKLAAYRHQEETEVEKPVAVLIPTEALKGAKGDELVTIQIGPEADGRRAVDVVFAGLTRSALAEAVHYPDCQRVIPASVNGKVAQFNPLLIADVVKGFIALHSKKQACTMTIGHNGTDGAALIDMQDPNFVAVLMPLRDTAKPPTHSHAWAKTAPGENPAGDLV